MSNTKEAFIKALIDSTDINVVKEMINDAGFSPEQAASMIDQSEKVMSVAKKIQTGEIQVDTNALTTLTNQVMEGNYTGVLDVVNNSGIDAESAVCMLSMFTEIIKCAF